MLHTFETTSSYTARKERRENLVQEWERTSKVNIYDDVVVSVAPLNSTEGTTNVAAMEEGSGSNTATSSPAHKRKSLDYARQLVNEEADVVSLAGSRFDDEHGGEDCGDDSQSLHTIGTNSDGSQPNLYDFANAEPSTYNPRHGSGFLRFFTCWTDHIKLSRRSYILLGSVFVILLVVIGAAVGASKKKPTEIEAASPPPIATDEDEDDRNPSFAHSLVSTLLMQHDILDITTFENLQSPQRLAVDYLLDSSLSTTKIISQDHMHLQDWKTNQVLRNLVELYSLAVIYYTTQEQGQDGSSAWRIETNWLDPTLHDPCTWHGITCGEVMVVTTEASSNAANRKSNGTEPHANSHPKNNIANGNVRIRGVTHLALSDNFMHGPLPMEIQFLHGLLELDLSHNELTGALPAVMPSALRILDLSQNRFSHQIPSLWSLPSLMVLDLHENDLKGPVPWGTDLNHWQSVRDVNLEHNFLTGSLPTAAQLPVVERLILNVNRFAGYLAADLGSMRHLKELSVRENRLRGALPTSLDQLTGLQILNVGENILGGTLEVCGRLADSLQELYVHQNRFHGQLPSFKSATGSKLSFLVTSRNELTGTLPSELGELTKLVELSLDFNKFTGTIPSTLDSLGALQILKLSDNNLEGEIPAALATRLQELHVDSNVGI